MANPFTLLCSMLLLAAPAFSMEGWMTDLAKARQMAEQQNKDLCIIYKGSSWHPEEYGTPERFFSNPAFMNAMKKSGFILVEQPYPPHYYNPQLLPYGDFNTPQAVAAGAPPIIWRNPAIKTTMLVLEASPGIIYQTWTAKTIQDPMADMEELKASGGAKSRQLHLIRKIRQAQGDDRYRLMKKLFSRNDWGNVMLLSPLYKSLYDEAGIRDKNNLSGIRINHIQEILEQVRQICWAVRGWACVADNMQNNRNTPLPEQIRENLDPEFLQILLSMQSTIGSMQNILSSAEQNPSSEFLEHCMADLQRDMEPIIALKPKSPHVQSIRQFIGRTVPLMYSLAQLDPASQPDQTMATLQNLLKQNWAKDYQVQQLLNILAAGCHLKRGELVKGLGIMTTWRDTFPWTLHAKNANDTIEHINANLDLIRELWNRKQQGDTEAAKQYQRHTVYHMDIQWGLSSN